MSDAEHDRIARLLREQGQAEAPPTLAEDVMARVRHEPQTTSARRGVDWRPVAAWAAVAAALLAVGIGIASLAPGGSSSSSGSAGGAASSLEAAAGGSKTSPPAQPSADSAAKAYTVPRHEAQKILSARPGGVTAPALSTQARDVVTLNRSQWNAVRRALAAAAARHPHPKDPVVIRLRPD